MRDRRDFDLAEFLPYLLNQAAEATSRGFSRHYRDAYGMTRTQWRVMAHLAHDGEMTASAICAASNLDKTKVSRAVAAMEQRGWLTRAASDQDRRAACLHLTDAGTEIHGALAAQARLYQSRLSSRLGKAETAALARTLRALVDIAD